MKRTPLTFISSLSLLLCAALMVLWNRSYHSNIVVPIKGASGWRLVVERGEIWVDDEPVWRVSGQLWTRRFLSFDEFAKRQHALLDEGLARASDEYRQGRIRREYFLAVGELVQENVAHLERVRLALIKDKPTRSSIRYHKFPNLWKLTGICALLPSVWLIRFGLNRRKLRGRCPTCSYDLTGNTSGVCPECGTAIPTSPKPTSPRPA